LFQVLSQHSFSIGLGNIKVFFVMNCIFKWKKNLTLYLLGSKPNMLEGGVLKNASSSTHGVESAGVCLVLLSLLVSNGNEYTHLGWLQEKRVGILDFNM
jgi:hypothetical protein